MHKPTMVLIVAVVFAIVAWFYISYQKFNHLRNHPAVQISYWQEVKYSQLPVEKRIFDVSPLIVDYLNMDNMEQGWANEPRPVQLSNEDRKLVEETIKELPEPIRKKLHPLLGGIVFVKNLGGSAITNTLVDNGRAVAGFIAFDEEVLKKTANEWARFKEKSPFDLKDTDQDLQMIIEYPKNDNIKNAFRFILHHEIGHILSLGEGMHPPWDQPERSFDPLDFKYSKLSWKKAEPKGFASNFPSLSQLRFYSESSKANLVDIYSALEKSDFPSLYAATNPMDDFADSFASYIHVVLDKKPYIVTILKGKTSAKTFVPCWGTERCRKKEEILAGLFRE